MSLGLNRNPTKEVEPLDPVKDFLVEGNSTSHIYVHCHVFLVMACFEILKPSHFQPAPGFSCECIVTTLCGELSHRVEEIACTRVRSKSGFSS
jgi:hypothetical protein